MKRYILFTSISLLSFISFSQINLVAVENLSDKWGFADEKGNMVIPFQYIEAHSFTSSGVAMVRDGGGWKIIDKDGKTVSVEVKNFEPKSYPFFTRGFKGEMVLIVVGKKYGYLNASGSLVVPVEYDELSEFRGDYAIGKIGASYYIVNKSGNKTKINVDTDQVKYLINGYAVYRSKKLLGYVDGEGNNLIDPKYSGAGNFYNGFAWARDPASATIGFINTKGEWIIQPQYKEVTDLDEKYNVSVARDMNSKVFLQYMDGKRIEIEGARDAGDLSEGFAWVRKGELVGLIDHTGKWIIEAKFNKIEKMRDGYVVVKSESFEGLYDKAGKMIFSPEYQKVENISEGLFRVKKADKWGYLDASGKMVIDFQFEGAEDFNNGYAQVKKGTTWGMIDKAGNLVIEPVNKRVKEMVSF